MARPSLRWLLAGAALAVARAAAAQAAPAPPPGYVLAWSEAFKSGDQPEPPDATVWAHELGAGGWGNHELEYYTDDLRNAFVQDGRLHIRARLADPRRPGGAGPTSARLISRPGLLAPYGYVEVRAKPPCGRGAWPAIWMLGERGTWPQQGEMDLMEWSGRYFREDEVQSALHAGAFYGARARTLRFERPKACGAFHRFQMLWTPSEIRFGVDDDPRRLKLAYARPAGAGRDAWPFDQPPRLILNVAVGGDLGGPVQAPTDGQFEMLVDYIRIYRPAGQPPSPSRLPQPATGAPFPAS